MAITQQVVPSKLRHLQSFVSSGSFYPPLGTTVVYVAVLGATGSAGAGGRYAGGSAGAGKSAGGYVQVNPQAPHVVSIGAGGSSGTGGTTSFDGAITAIGSNAGNAGQQGGYWGQAGNAGTAGSISGVQSLPALNPGGSTVARVSSFTNGSDISGSSVSGIVHIYGY